MHVLIIDDDPGTLETLSIGLRKFGGHIVATAPSVAAGLALMTQHAYDEILLDLNLPDGSGLDVLAGLSRTRSASARVRVITGFASMASALESGKLGAIDYLQKPIDVDDLIRRLDESGQLSCAAAPPIIDRRITAVVELINSQPLISEALLAAAVGLSESRLRHLFSEAIGRSLSKYLNDVRLDRAAEALRGTNEHVNQIAHRHGFEDAGYFSKVFRERFGLGPSAFRVMQAESRQDSRILE